MGKNHRYKKKLRSEKSKVHITSKTKFLPKGQNVTNTAFKIKPIVINEQLKEREKDVPLSKKKYSVNELISKLKHYNDNIKLEACQDLKDMIKIHTIDILQTNLSLIIQTASTLIQDRERKVRRACINLLNDIFQNVPTFKLEAFFTYILINLKCAMTNINKNIQEDSLLLLDSLLEHQPQLISNNFEKIFPDFLTLISKLRSQAAPERTLTLNLGSKITSVKWRIKVLSRLYGILAVMIKNCQRKNESSGNDYDNVKSIVLKASDSNYIPIYKNAKIYERCPYNFISNSTNEVQTLNRHVITLIPLLHETWLEMLPEKSSKKNFSEATVLSGESAAIFSCVVNILCLLYEYSQFNNIGEIFSSKDSTTFFERLVCDLPYSQTKVKNSEFTKDFSKLFHQNSDPNCVKENLIIINFFVTLKINLNSDNIKNKISTITNYINKCLSSHAYLNSKNVTYFVDILKEILLYNSKLWHRHGFNNVEIMNNVIKFYDEEKIPGDSKNDILEILTSTFPYRYEKQQEWLDKLPRQLCKKKVSAKLIVIILNLCKQNHKPIQEGIQSVFKDILDNLPTMEITDVVDKMSAELSLVYIFFYLPDLNESNIKIIYDFMKSHKQLSYTKYFKEMLDFKLNVFNL